MTIRVGTKLYGYCGGYFGDNWNEKRVETIAEDYIVVRDENGVPLFESFDNYEQMEQCLSDYLTDREME